MDTSVLIAGTRSNRGASFRLLRLIPDDRFQLCLSMPLYLEYMDVLTRPEHLIVGLTVGQAVGAVRYLAGQAHLQEIYFHWRPFLRDSKDDMVLELAVAADATRIITFNLKDFAGTEQFGVKALKPSEFLFEIGELR